MKRTPVKAKGPMEPLTPQELNELRKMIDDDRLDDADKDALIRTLDHIVQSFILAARGLGSVGVTLSDRANAVFQNPGQHDIIQKYDINERVDLGHPDARGGEIETQSPMQRLRRPEHT